MEKITTEFYQISIRGRLAFGMTCLEKLVIALESDHPLLQTNVFPKIWEFTSSDDLSEWEENIRAVTEAWGVSIRADIDNILPQLKAITTVAVEKNKPWAELALERARRLAPQISRGATNILNLHRKLN